MRATFRVECSRCGPTETAIVNHERDRAEQAEAALAAERDAMKHLRSRWDWTEYWFDNLYPNDWLRCQAEYDARKPLQ